jgi:hypothetical protein
MRESPRASTISYEAEVLEDGRLPVPKNAKLAPGQRVRVRLRLAKAKQAQKRDALWEIVGLCTSDPARDVARRHDSYLYGPGGEHKKAVKR